MPRINVTKTFLPPKEDFLKYINRIWDSAWLTNNGPLLQELEKNLEKYLNTPNLLVCSSGTVVLQLALKALNITGAVITTPFSYVATLNAIIWEGCKPVFVDIDPQTFCIDASKIEAAITPETQAILCTHVYGLPCDVDAIEKIARKHNLKVIYDAAHAFGAKLNGRSLLQYGDVSTCSFHATKLFHSVEGGSIYAEDNTVYETIKKLRQFGHVYDDYYYAGINAKNSELHAAMGLSVLPYTNSIIEERRKISEHYDALLKPLFKPHTSMENYEFNYGYYPVLMPSEAVLLKVKDALEKADIFPRRYFYPTLNTLPYLTLPHYSCPVSEDVALRALCLPLYAGLAMKDVERIAEITNSML